MHNLNEQQSSHQHQNWHNMWNSRTGRLWNRRIRMHVHVAAPPITDQTMLSRIATAAVVRHAAPANRVIWNIEIIEIILEELYGSFWHNTYFRQQLTGPPNETPIKLEINVAHGRLIGLLSGTRWIQRAKTLMARQSHLRKLLIVAAAAVVHIEAGTARIGVGAFVRCAQIAETTANRVPIDDASETTVFGGIGTIRGRKMGGKFGTTIVILRWTLNAGICYFGNILSSESDQIRFIKSIYNFLPALANWTNPIANTAIVSDDHMLRRYSTMDETIRDNTVMIDKLKSNELNCVTAILLKRSDAH